MRICDFKPKLEAFLLEMMCEWFPDKKFLKSLGNALIRANINKYDTFLEMFADEQGNIDVEGLVNSIEETIEIDLQQLSPLLPNRVLVITKEDLQKLL